MSRAHIDVRHIAKLARLELTDEEITLFQPQLDAILSHADALAKVDVSSVSDDSYPCPTIDHMREDVPKPSLPASLVLQNAPEQAQDQIRVPKVVGDA